MSDQPTRDEYAKMIKELTSFLADESVSNQFNASGRITPFDIRGIGAALLLQTEIQNHWLGEISHHLELLVDTRRPLGH